MSNSAFSQPTNSKAGDQKLTLSRNHTRNAYGIKKKQASKYQSLHPEKSNKPLQKRYRSLELRKNKAQPQGYKKKHGSRITELANKQSTATSTSLSRNENAVGKLKIQKKNSTLTKRKKRNFTRNCQRSFNHKTRTTIKPIPRSHKKNIFDQRNPFDKPQKLIPSKTQKKFPNPHSKHTMNSSSPELENKIRNIKIDKKRRISNDSQNKNDSHNIQVTQKNQKNNKNTNFQNNLQSKKIFPQDGNKKPKKITKSRHKSSSFTLTYGEDSQTKKPKQQQQEKTRLINQNCELNFDIRKSTFRPIDQEDNFQNSKTHKQTPSGQTVITNKNGFNKQENKNVSKTFKANKNDHTLKKEKDLGIDRKRKNTLPKNEELSGIPTAFFSPSKIVNNEKVNRSYSKTPQEPFVNSQRINSTNQNIVKKNNQLYSLNPKKKIIRMNSFNNSFQKNFKPEIYKQPKPLLPVTKGKPTNLNTISPDTLCDLLDGSYKKKHGIEFSKVLIIDCRFDWEYEGGHIEGAKNWNLPRVLLHKLFCKEILENVCIVFHCEFSQHRGPKMYQVLRNADRNINRFPTLHYPELYVLEKGYKGFFKSSNRTKRFCCPQGYRKMQTKKYQTQMKEDYRNFKLNLKDHQKRTILSLEDILTWYGSFEQPISIKHNHIKKVSNLRTRISSSQQTISTTTTLSNSKPSPTTTSARQKITPLYSKRDRTNSSLCRKRPLYPINRTQREFTVPFGSKTLKCKEALLDFDLDSILNYEPNFSLFRSPDIGELSEHFQKETVLGPKKKTTKNISKICTALKFGNDQDSRNDFLKNQNNVGIELRMEVITDTETDTDIDSNKVTRTTTESESQSEMESESDRVNNNKSKKCPKINYQEEKETKKEKTNDNNPHSETHTDPDSNSSFNYNSKKKQKLKKKKKKKKKIILKQLFQYSQPTKMKNYTNKN
ncbi:cdc25-like protein phosphatase twine-related [Anaeramoeba flamelloides]|uniref:protein-tyrosine-phosphatase n=1 Tax=Anaeramoeba flamelloides TaxID=1746091 RepID=A0AAV8AE46_9EUKA|nr:cdc25-like protein phosphatase twine-related [Anaeramoeba flamelloides]